MKTIEELKADYYVAADAATVLWHKAADLKNDAHTATRVYADAAEEACKAHAIYIKELNNEDD